LPSFTLLLDYLYARSVFLLPQYRKEAERMQRQKLARLCLLLFPVIGAAQTTSPGHVNFMADADSSWDHYFAGSNPTLQKWILSHYTNMLVFSGFFDAQTSWYPNAYLYMDLYGIQKGSWEQIFHPEWILKDQDGNWLYIPFNCGGGTCAQYAADIANPAFRKAWITEAAGITWAGNYVGPFIDDVNLNFNVSDGYGNLVAPIDSNTGAPMTWDAWRNYMAAFLEEFRAAMPNKKFVENSIWFANPNGVQDGDPAIQRQIATADKITMERGVASDARLTGGTGFFSVYSFFNYIDRIHAAGKAVILAEYSLDRPGQQYGLASYFLISNGNDEIGDQTATPDNWWTGYDVELGTPLGPRSYNKGVFERDFSGGKVLLGEPGLAPQTVDLGGTFTTLDGSQVTSVTLGGSQGFVLLATGAVAPPAGGVTRFLSDMTPNYVLNGWGPSYQNDKSIIGQPLTISGVTYSKGLGVHAYSELRFPLSGNCTSFTATVGIDDEVPTGQAHETFQVWADGYLLYNSGFMASGTPSQPVSVDLTGRQSLGLVETNGVYRDGSPGTDWGHGDWANAKIVCAH
jgi:NPCBM/NEW2 domain-containing protein/putative glycosyl hydrolase-like family 15 (GHL15) protein